MAPLNIAAIVFGWVILILVSSYAIPQLVTVIRTKNTSGLSIPAFCLFVLSNLGMFCWGIGNAIRGQQGGMEPYQVWLILIPNVITNFMNMCINIICLTLKIRHVKLAKEQGISEDQLAKQMLAQRKKQARKAGK